MAVFSCPTFVYGDDSLEYLLQLDGKKAFIVTDKNMVTLGLTKLVTDKLDEAGIGWEIFDDIEPEPSAQSIKNGGVAVDKYQPDWVIGLGGGSCMDAAKAIIILLANPGLEPHVIKPTKTFGSRKKARLMAIPTTAGTGSEATFALILADTERQRKLLLGTRELTPDVAILDPVMVAGLPPQLTAETGMDAMCHAIEGYTSIWGTSITDGPGLIAIRQIFRFLAKSYHNGEDLKARKEMQSAAGLAGLSFGNSMAGLAHSAGHMLGIIFHVPHGRAVGIFLPYTMEFLINGSEKAVTKFAEIARYCGMHGDSDLDCARLLIDGIRNLAGEIGLPTTVADTGIDKKAYEEAIPLMVGKALKEVTTHTVTRIPDEKQLADIFRYGFEGKRIDF